MINTFITPAEIAQLDPNARRVNSVWPPDSLVTLLSDLRGFLFGPKIYNTMKWWRYPGGVHALPSGPVFVRPDLPGFFRARRAARGLLPGE